MSSNPPLAAYGRPLSVTALLKWQETLKLAMLAPVPTAWRLEETARTSAVTLKYNLNSCVAGYVLHPEWQNVAGVTLQHTTFKQFFSYWIFVDVKDAASHHVTMIPRTSELMSHKHTKNQPRQSGGLTAEQDKRLQMLRLSVENLADFTALVHIMNLGVITFPVPLRGQLDERHLAVLAASPNSTLEYLERTDETGETWTYLF